MKALYKYPLEFKEEQCIHLPKGSTILSAIEQYGSIVVYALTNVQCDSLIPVKFKVLPTGHIDVGGLDTYIFLASLKFHHGKLIFHVFYQCE